MAIEKGDSKNLGGIYRPVKQRNGNGQSHYSSIAASELTCRTAIEDLQLSSVWRLGKLLGMRWPGHASRYLTGEYRISPLYLVRLCQLYHLAWKEGLDLRLVDSIDYENFSIHMKSGIKKKLPGQTSSLDRFMEAPPWVQQEGR
jgi:hypothetical protein